MAFRFIQPAASGSLQYLLSRRIEDPATIDLTDTPSDGNTGLVSGSITGSAQSILFDGIDDLIKLPTTGGLYTEFLLEGVGAQTLKHGSTANNIMFETWLKLSDTSTGTTNEYFEATIQRNAASSTTGFDGIYSNRLMYASSGGAGDTGFLTSGHFIDFQFASGSHMSWSLTSAKSIIPETWNHVITSYISGDTASNSKMQIWVNGSLDREQSLAELTGLALGGETDALPATALPLAARGGSITFGGRLDEVKMWLNSGTPSSINTLAAVTSIALSPEQMNTDTATQFSPSAEYLAAWWNFESVSAFELFAGVADSIEDYTGYGNNGTPLNFVGSVDFSEEQTIVYGVSASGDLTSLKGGSIDHGGLVLFDNLNGTLTLEEGIENLVKEASNTWSASGNASVTLDEKQIFTGTSAVRVNFAGAGDAVVHTINYNPENFFDENVYTCGIRLLSSTGSASARVVFTLGNHTNTASTTAIMNGNTWQPILLKNTVSADFNETTITGSIVVQQLHNGGTDFGSLFTMDSLFIKEGEHMSEFVAPDAIRKSGQMYWGIGD